MRDRALWSRHAHDGTRRGEGPRARGEIQLRDPLPPARAARGAARRHAPRGAVAVPLLHGGLRAPARDDPPRHPPLLRPRAHLPRLPDRQARLRAAGAAGPASSVRHLPAGLDPRRCRGGGGAARAADSARRSRLPGRQPDAERRDPRRRAGLRAARGDPPLRRLAAADHRASVHGLRHARAVDARHPGPPRLELRAADRPSLPDDARHLRHRARRRRDLRLPLRAVRRLRDPHRPRPAFPRLRRLGRGALRRRAGEGRDLRLGPVRDDLRLVGREHRHGRLADHPGDDPPRLQEAFRGGGRSRPPRPAGRSRRRSWARRRS